MHSTLINLHPPVAMMFNTLYDPTPISSPFVLFVMKFDRVGGHLHVSMAWCEKGELGSCLSFAGILCMSLVWSMLAILCWHMSKLSAIPQVLTSK